MKDLYTFNNYKNFVKNWVAYQPKRGHGQYKRIADHLRVGTVLISQIFNGDRDLSEEQAYELSQFLGLLERETKYFICLVRLARAGSKKLQIHIQNEINDLIKDAGDLKKNIQSEINLDEKSQSIFYSDWFYSAIRLATDIPSLRDLPSLSKRLELPPEKLKAAVEFLLATGLCEIKEGELRMGPKIVFLPSDSPFIQSRQKSWRIKGFQKMENSSEENLFFTCPIVCSHKSAKLIRKKTMNFIAEILEEVKESNSEELLCLNIDWFKI